MGTGIQESTPLVYAGTMYVPNSGDYIQAFDAKTGELEWEYKRAYPEGVRGGTNRNLAIWGTTLIDASGDNMMYAVDARTGKLVWETKVLEPTLPARASSGPIIANGKVITGRQCQPAATNDSCVITAHDAKTGKELWRTRTIPRKGEPGDETWGDVPMEQRWHVGTWMVPSYDPVLDEIYIGTSVTIPAPKFILGGVDKQHLYHNSTLALDPATGKIDWYYQHLLDHWDLDHPFERLLVDTAVAPDPSEVAWINPSVRPGERRKVITGIPGKTGIVYTLDRETGEFLWARPTVFQNVVTNIDGATGKVTENPDVIWTRKDQTLMVCPGTNGGKNWPAGRVQPEDQHDVHADAEHVHERHHADGRARPEARLRLQHRVHHRARREGGRRRLGDLGREGHDALEARAAHGRDVARRDGRRARVRRRRVGRVQGYDDTTGKVLWETNLGSPVSGYPVTFAVGGKQYVAVTTGPSLVAAAARRVTPELAGGLRRCASLRVRAAVSGARMRRRAHRVALRFSAALAALLLAAAAHAQAPAAKRRISIGTSRPRARRPAPSTRPWSTGCARCPTATAPARHGGPARRGRRRDPPRESWHAEPQKVFDNFYFVGMTEFSSWAVTTSDGIIVIDPLFDYSVEDEVVEGSRSSASIPRTSATC